MTDFLFNNTSARGLGLLMGNGFIVSLETPAEMKDGITNTSRLEHGDRYIPICKLASRSVTLEFVIKGSNHDDYEAKVDAFLKLLHNGYVTICVPKSRSDVYRLYPQLKSCSYSKGFANGGTIGKMSVKFLEANPNDRDEFNREDAEKIG